MEVPTQVASPDPSEAVNESGRWPWFSLCAMMVILAAFVALRLPVCLHQPPGQDEECFAVPGYTILRTGLPQIPYMPSRNPAGAFYRADEILYALPPAYFYFQAGWYAVFGAGTGIARTLNLVLALLAIGLVWRLAKVWLGSQTWGPLLAAGLYTISRMLFFPTVMVRPDLLCAVCGLLMVASLVRWQRSGGRRWLFIAGGWLGLASLTHPFALVMGGLAAWWIIVGTLFPDETLEREWKRPGSVLMTIGNLLSLGVVAGLVLCFWLPLIAVDPELFREQFGNNVFRRSGPGLLSRFVWPFPAATKQMELLGEYLGTGPFVFLIGSLLAMTILSLVSLVRRERDRRLCSLVATTWMTLYLHIACQGMHVTKGYWCFTGVLLILVLAETVVRIAGFIERWVEAHWVGSRESSSVAWGVPTILMLLTLAGFLPGAGLQAGWIYLRHGGEDDYSAPRFTARLIKTLPQEGVFVVDQAHVFDIHRSGRDVRVAMCEPYFYDVRGEPFDYLITSRFSLQERVSDQLGTSVVSERGRQDNPFTSYARIEIPPP